MTQHQVLDRFNQLQALAQQQQQEKLAEHGATLKRLCESPLNMPTNAPQWLSDVAVLLNKHQVHTWGDRPLNSESPKVRDFLFELSQHQPIAMRLGISCSDTPQQQLSTLMHRLGYQLAQPQQRLSLAELHL